MTLFDEIDRKITLMRARNRLSRASRRLYDRQRSERWLFRLTPGALHPWLHRRLNEPTQDDLDDAVRRVRDEDERRRAAVRELYRPGEQPKASWLTEGST